MVLRLTSCSPRRSGLFVTFIGEISFADLTPTIEASGPHDFAVRKIALSSATQLASIASRPYVRDDRETPLCVGRDGGGYRGDLGQMGTGIFLRGGLGRVLNSAR